MKRRQFLTTAAVSMPLIAGCGGGGYGGGDQQQEQQQNGSGGQSDTTVKMKNTAFNPVKAEVDVGATVKWVNKDSFAHDVTSAQFSDGAASWDIAETLDGGQSTTYTFDSRGFYEYKCTIHSKKTMCGVIIVGGVSYDGSLPCQDNEGGGGY